MLHAQNGATDAKLRHDEHGHLKHGKLGDLVEIGPPDLGFLARISMQHGSRRRDSPESGRRRGGGRGRSRSGPDLAGSGRGNSGEAREGGVVRGSSGVATQARVATVGYTRGTG